MPLILAYLGLEEISNEETLRVIYGDARPTEVKEKLQKWLLLLPDSIAAQIDAALRQERPFLPPDITPKMMAAKNSIVPSMTQMDILYRCVNFAFEARDFNMAACLAYVVDRATYWSGASKALLQVVDLIKQTDPLVAIAPQIQVREARVLKDEGDLHGAMKVLNNILERRQDQPGEWKYVDEDQYLTTKAEIIKIKGHILYNMGAFVLNFNPTTSVWTSQSTLAFLGDELDLTEDNKGNCRDAFHVQFLHQDEPRGRYVGKRYRNGRHHHPARYMQDVVCQMMAGYYVTKFNEAMQNYKRDIQVQFLPAAHLQLLTPYGDLEDCINVEPYLHGDFIKLTNNLSWAYMEHDGNDLATALSHFSYCESKGTVMIVDIQGWLPREGSGIIYLTDPQFHTVGLEKFSPYDYQEVGMKKFWEDVHPRCNDMCRAIGLERLQE